MYLLLSCVLKWQDGKDHIEPYDLNNRQMREMSPDLSSDFLPLITEFH
jgi:hypothetical protein